MVAEFNGKADLKKVSQTIKDFVLKTAKMDGNKKKIDSDREFFELSNLLAGNCNSMNNDEINYVQGLMVEYQNKKFDNNVTENTKKEVSKIAKRMGDKKKIDTDEEAQALAIMLRNSHNELNAADLVYVRNLLIASGYGFYLNDEPKPVNIVNIVINENENTNDTGEPADKFCEEEQHIQKVDKEEQPNNQPPINKIRPKRPNVEDKTPPKPEKTKPVIAEEDRSEGFGLADRVVHELNSHIADNRAIRDALKKVNPKNAYSFIGKFVSAANRGVNDGVFSVTDLLNRLTYKDTVHVMEMLLKQAADLKLNDTNEYKELEFCIKSAHRKIDANPDTDPEDFEINADDKAISALYERMSKEYE